MTGEEKAVLEEEVLGSTEQTSGFGHIWTDGLFIPRGWCHSIKGVGVNGLRELVVSVAFYIAIPASTEYSTTILPPAIRGVPILITAGARTVRAYFGPA